ncbi:hypothetical protein [Actinocorallia populi]|uniref:hypothetical protein n=1 Tax=Actinocorallia populi TaxID=2079200 RepID=UPI000D087721|nr:hypothetical protein [Actinocorallia populi]
MAERDLLLVFSDPKPGLEDVYNDWYDRTHLAEIVATPGVVSGRRYELAPVEAPGVAGPAHRHLAVYELDRDPEEIMAEFVGRTVSGEIGNHEALDMSTISVAIWRARGPRLESS